MNNKKNSPIKQFGNTFGSVGVFGGGNPSQMGSSVLNSLDPLKNKTNPSNTALTPFGSYNSGLHPLSNLGAMGFNQFKAQEYNGIPKGFFGAGNQDYGLGGILKNSQYALNKQREMKVNEARMATNNKRLVDRGLLPPQPKANSTAPLAQLKSNNMEYNNINNKAFSNIDNIKNVMGESLPNTFTRKVGNSPIKQNVDPSIDPMIAQNIDSPLQPPSRIATPTTPPYDINNY